MNNQTKERSNMFWKPETEKVQLETLINSAKQRLAVASGKEEISEEKPPEKIPGKKKKANT